MRENIERSLLDGMGDFERGVLEHYGKILRPQWGLTVSSNQFHFSYKTTLSIHKKQAIL